ncbi:hypothetical protein GGR21_003726 [Dysgonomonas hofstadii]|uniref:YgjP-like metallopeptidase domain-containing protein n=1 Tax=Dysgonomonas hofstadii TaxID=637886 RepID=A0A840CYI5_9BACT|nr:M48 family metallopeptidase [Dysgonomonas hofstadii]MBB4037805.1 hypothetical protein [Dysgonomonas hofstadii]
MEIIKDKDLGDIKLIANSRAKKIIVRRRNGLLQLTHPSSVSISYIKQTIEEMKPRLLKLTERETSPRIFTPGTDFKTFSFSLYLRESISTQNYYMSLKDGILNISCPAGTDYKDTSTQKTIKELIEKAFRYEANRIFPSKVAHFAKKHGFTFTGVKINKSRSRWGSCSSKKSINLSHYCMLLPEHLIDFIVLHELCHTIEMNHGDRFWQLLDKVSDGKARELTKELKSYKTDW